jgi:pyruvate formate lyase activating enzyme
LDEVRGLVFDIQSYSVHDGPGCRTLIFLMGCPLRCEWCANPEGMEQRQRIMYRTTKCKHQILGCKRCVASCPRYAITIEDQAELPVTNWDLCQTCTSLDCANACLNEARKICGKWYTVPDIMRILNRDRQYWLGEGGVTFSGGDPIMQKDFLLAMLKRCHDAYINTAIETSACFNQDIFLDVMRYVDFAFIDIKHMDPVRHQQKTGVTNDLILRNVAALSQSSWAGRLVIRMPIIKNFNDTDENAVQTAEFLNSVGLKEMNILPFHRMGDSKWKQCGKQYPYSEYEATDEQVLQRLQKIYREHGIICYTAFDTPF